MSRRKTKKRYIKMADNSKKEKNELDNIKFKTKDGKIIKSEEIVAYARKIRSSVDVAQRLAQVSSHTGNYQPTVSESYINDINFNPMSVSTEELEMMLLNPRKSANKLRSLSQYLQNAVGQYQKLMYYYTGLLSFDTMLVPKDIDNSNIVSDADYQKSYFNSCNIVKAINPKTNFISMLNQTVKNGFSVWWMLEDKNSGVNGFIQLPTDWCYITSKTNYGWTASLDLTFFDRIAWTPSLIPELWEEYKKFNQMRIDLANGKSDDDCISFQYYPLPIERTWVFTFDPDDASKIPPLANTFQSALDWLSYRKLLKDMSILDNWKTLSAKIPQKKNSDELIVSYDEAFEIIDAVQENLPENMTIFATPFDVTPIALNQVNTLNDLVGMSNNNFYSNAGTTGQFFGEMESTKSAKAIDVNQKIDYLFISKQMYPQFEKWTNLALEIRNSKKHKFEARYSGNEIDKKEEIGTALSVSTSANFPISYLAAKVGFLPHEVVAVSNIENVINVKTDILKPLASQHTQSTNEGGRPTDSISETTNDGTIASKESRGGV